MHELEARSNVPGLSELLHTSCSTMAMASIPDGGGGGGGGGDSHISGSQRGTVRRQRAVERVR